jgi:Sortilin, neurotensin receptor 3,/Sortilin, neurotensin receptor 3, C-terminal
MTMASLGLRCQASPKTRPTSSSNTPLTRKLSYAPNLIHSDWQAFILTSEKTHYRTSDRGKSWHAFQVEDAPSVVQPPLVFSADNDDYILYIGTRCSDSGGWSGFTCRDHAYYTKNGFDKSPKPMVEGVLKCMFARSTKDFHKDSKKGVFCIDVDADSSRNWPENLRLIKSEDWFETTEVVEVDSSKKIRGFIGMGSVHTFIVAAVKSAGTEELALYVTDDGENWDRAQFPEDHGGIMEEAYTILPSTGHSIQVDVLSSQSTFNQIGTLFTSNSNGSYFVRSLEYTNRNNNGIVDFEQVQNIEGIILANIVTNHEDVKANPRTAIKVVQSRISFDDGHSWAPLRLTTGDNYIHLHSESEFHNTGTVFSSAAPGIVMGVGNAGIKLNPYGDCDFFVSSDAGFSWRKARDGPHQYEFGDQGGILVAVPDRDDTRSAFYSYDYGTTWEELDLGESIHPVFLTTMPDSTSERFTLLAKRGETYIIFALNFEGTRTRKCNLDKRGDGGDFEKWYARVDKEGTFLSNGCGC